MQPKKKDWLSENIVAVIAIAFTCFLFFVFSFILFRETKTDNSTTTVIITSLTNMEFMILGFYFVSSKSNKEKDKQIEDLMKKPSSIKNIEQVNFNQDENESK